MAVTEEIAIVVCLNGGRSSDVSIFDDGRRSYGQGLYRPLW